MARSRSWYKRNYRRYKNKYKGSYSKRSYGQFRAAKQQADQSSFIMNIPTTFTAKTYKENLAGNTYSIGTYALNIYDLMRKSEYYKSYANMYDEFKIDNVKVKLVPTKFNVTVGQVNGAGYQTFTVYTAWDRTGLNSRQLFLNTANGVYNNDPINPNQVNSLKNYELIGKNNDKDGVYILVGDDITTYSSAESKQVGLGQNSSIVRWLKPKTLQEKSQWLSTESLVPWFETYDQINCCYTSIPTSDVNRLYPDMIGHFWQLGNAGNVYATLSKISPAVAGNPCFLEEDPAIKFKPILLVGLYPTDDPTVQEQTPRAITFNAEVEVSCSFRGLRRARVVQEEIKVQEANFVQQNPIEAEVNEEELDDAMSDDGEQANLNMRNRALRDGELIPYDDQIGNGVIWIKNFKNSQFVKSNPGNLGYATSIKIKLPKGADVTPINCDGLRKKSVQWQKVTDQDDPLFDNDVGNNPDAPATVTTPATIIPWDQMQEKTQGDHSTVLNPGDRVTIAIPDQKQTEHGGLMKKLTKYITLENLEKTAKVIAVAAPKVKMAVNVGVTGYKAIKWGIDVYNASKGKGGGLQPLPGPTVDTVKRICSTPVAGLLTQEPIVEEPDDDVNRRNGEKPLELIVISAKGIKRHKKKIYMSELRAMNIDGQDDIITQRLRDDPSDEYENVGDDEDFLEIYEDDGLFRTNLFNEE
jgi:hypothetical protein